MKISALVPCVDIANLKVEKMIVGNCVKNEGANSNKFYQAELQHGSNGSTVYVVYGRTGETIVERQYLYADRTPLDQADAEKQYRKIVVAKFGYAHCPKCSTKNDAGTINCSDCGQLLRARDYTKKYAPVHMAQSALGSSEAQATIKEEEVNQAKVKVASTPTSQGPGRTFDKGVVWLVETIYKWAGQQVMSSLNTGQLKAGADNPLGTLGITQLQMAQQVLNELDEELKNKASQAILKELTREWYATIPQAIGMRPNWESLIIVDRQMLLKAMELLDLLTDVQGVISGFSANSDISGKYDNLTADIVTIPHSDSMFKRLSDFVQSSKSDNHNFTIQIHNIFDINLHGITYRDAMPNQMELFHGSRGANWVGILDSGLRVRPSNAVHTGSNFGDGLYFAINSTKSLQYCAESWSWCNRSPGNRSSKRVLLAVCDVAMGKYLDYYDSDSSLHRKVIRDGYDSTWARSKSYNSAGWLIHDEFIVYRTEQQRVRYLVDITLS